MYCPLKKKKRGNSCSTKNKKVKFFVYFIVSAVSGMGFIHVYNMATSSS